MVVSVKCDYKVLGVFFSLLNYLIFFYNKHVLLVQKKMFKKRKSIQALLVFH